MNKCYSRFGRLMLTAATIGIMTASCSDDDKEYADDVYFTGSQPAVVVVDAKGSSEAGGVSAATKVTFDAAANWTISAKELNNPSQVANWVSFFTSAGEEGSQILGVYVTANTDGQDRAAFIEISSNGKTESFTLVQQGGVPGENPNKAAIDPAKTINKIEYYAAGATTPSKTIDFMYNGDGVLSSETITEIDGDNSTAYGYTMTATGNVNKLTVTRSDAVAEGETFAVLNGKVALGYNTLTVKTNTNLQQIAFSYNQDHVTTISGGGVNCDFAWGNANLGAVNCESPVAANVSASYGSELNDCNLDLNWLVGLEGASCGATAGSNALAVMNLIGKRSEYLVATSGNETFTYAAGVRNSAGENVEGMTITTSTNRTIKVYFAEAE